MASRGSGRVAAGTELLKPPLGSPVGGQKCGACGRWFPRGHFMVRRTGKWLTACAGCTSQAKQTEVSVARTETVDPKEQERLERERTANRKRAASMAAARVRRKQQKREAAEERARAESLHAELDSAMWAAVTADQPDEVRRRPDPDPAACNRF